MTESEPETPYHADHIDPAELPITWGLFVALEMAPMGDYEAVREFYDAAIAELGEEGLLRGWHLVAVALRKALQEHASQCACGSDQWLEGQQVVNAAWAEGDRDA